MRLLQPMCPLGLMRPMPLGLIWLMPTRARMVSSTHRLQHHFHCLRSPDLPHKILRNLCRSEGMFLEKWDATINSIFLLCSVGKVVDGALAPSEFNMPITWAINLEWTFLMCGAAHFLKMTIRLLQSNISMEVLALTNDNNALGLTPTTESFCPPF
jgi:hypothetical protein